MSSIFLKIVDVTRETADAITIHFEHPEGKIIASKAGQFLTLIIPFNGTKVRRSYSLCSAPHEAPRLAVTVKKIPGGLVSNYLVDNCAPGMAMEVLEPIGNFNISTNPANSRNLVLIGAGSGITPLISMAKAVLYEEPQSKVTLIYGNRHENSVIFKENLAQLEQKYAGRFVVEHVYSQPRTHESLHKHTGRLNRSTIIKILESLRLTDFLDTEYYMCGPEGLMDEAKAALQMLKVGPERIHKESFVAKQDSKEEADVTNTVDLKEDNADCHIVTILYEGAEYKVPVPKNQTILEAGLDNEIDLPFSCQAGLCTACRGKCLSGKIHLDEREGLSDAEMNEGYVLLCVGHPLTKDVVVEIG